MLHSAPSAHPPRLYSGDTALLSQSWRPDTVSRRPSKAVTTLLKFFTTWELRLNAHKTETVIFTKRRPHLPDPIQTQDNFVPWASTVRYLGHVLDSKLRFSQHLPTVANKATGVSWNIFLLLVRDLALTQCNKLIFYKVLIRTIRTYAAPVWSSTFYSNYVRLQVIQSKCLRAIGYHPRHTSTSHSKQWAHLRDSQILCSLSLPSQTPGPTKRELYSSRPDRRVQEYKQKTEAYTAVISLPKVIVFFFRNLYCRYLQLYLYSLLFHLCHCVYISLSG